MSYILNILYIILYKILIFNELSYINLAGWIKYWKDFFEKKSFQYFIQPARFRFLEVKKYCWNNHPTFVSKEIPSEHS